MKNLLKAFLAITIILLGVKSNAQSPVTWGIKAGVNMSDITNTDNSKTKFGIQGGVTMDYAFTNEWYLLTGLEYTSKGVKGKDNAFVKDAKTNLSYLQLPIHAGYKLELAPDAKLVFEAGPYLAYGIGGKTKYTAINDIDPRTTKDYESDAFSDDTHKRFDFGLGAGIGAEVSKISLRIGYDFGLTNIAQVGDSRKNGNAYFTVGYKF